MSSSAHKGADVKVDINVNADAKSDADAKSLSSSSSASSSPSSSSGRVRVSSLEQGSGLLSYMTVSWLNPLMALGALRPLEEIDIPDLRDDLKAHNVKQLFKQHWAKELEKGASASLIRAVFNSFGTRFFIGALFKMLADGMNFVNPLLLIALVNFIGTHANSNPNPDPAWHGYLYAVSMFVASLITILCMNEFTRTSLITGVKIRTALVTAIYEKSLRLSPKARLSMPTGQMVNMMSVDASKIDLCCALFHYSWTVVIQVTVAIALLIWQIGVASLTGICVILMFIPIQVVVNRFLSSNRRHVAAATDRRLKMMNEILQGIKVIKVYAWERSFLSSLSVVRALEMHYVTISQKIRGINGSLNLVLPTLTQTLPFVTLSLISSDGTLNASQVFAALVLFNQIRIPVILLPIVFAQIADARIAFSRIRGFLLAEELSYNPESVTGDDAASVAIRLKDVKFSWEMSTADLAKMTTKAAPPTTATTTLAAKTQASLKGEKAASTLPALPPASSSSPQSSSSSSPSSSSSDNSNNYVFSLDHLNIVIKRGQLTAIIGSVGSGKSSLLQGILGEMKQVSGQVQIDGTISYCPQQAWIQNATLRDNILFGLPYDEAKYERTLTACSLRSDLAVLPAGDLTEIGERGINLSGGQKQRVSLARSVYFDADIVMWDDPLSAVDSHVARHLFTRCICGELASKTRVLVTHQLQFVPYVDTIIHMRDGRVYETGTYDELMASSEVFRNTMKGVGGYTDDDTDEDDDDKLHDGNGSLGAHSKQETSSTSIAPVSKTASRRKLLPSNDKHSSSSSALTLSSSSSSSSSSSTSLTTTTAVAGTGKTSSLADGVSNIASALRSNNTGTVLMSSEEKARGTVASGVWLYYFRSAGGVLPCSLFLVLVMLTLTTRSLQDWFLSQWSVQAYSLSRAEYIGYFVLLGGAQMLVGTCFNVLMVKLGVNAATTLHDRSIKRVIRAPMAFFDTTPLGRIVNRFSTDQDVIDNTLALENLRMCPYWICSVLAILVLISVFSPYFAIVVPFLVGAYMYTQTRYRRSSRELKRFDAIGRSPLYAHFSETLTGLITIRAYRTSGLFIAANESRMNGNNRPYTILQCSNRWLGERLELLGATTVLATAMLAVASADTISPGTTGLILTYSLQTTILLTFLIRNIIDTENNMNAVERTKFYIENVPQERPESSDADSVLPAKWPNKGNIEISHLSIRYREGLPLVLNDLSVKIKGGQRVGVVGRTGAGKSSLMLALYRLVEASSGSILIDGVDISTLGTHALRSRLSIMPQDPVLYSGTVRSNLDPFSEHTDEEIWSALSKAYLRDAIARLDNGLDATVAEAGENFSVGQRCQICLARAMLRESPILIMDEATASIDLETDALIQASLRSFFKGTVLTIAHRLNTIVDYDAVMVLSFGSIVEFGSPAALLRIGPVNGIFASMVHETGEANKNAMTEIANNAEREREKELRRNEPEQNQNQNQNRTKMVSIAEIAEGDHLYEPSVTQVLFHNEP